MEVQEASFEAQENMQKMGEAEATSNSHVGLFETQWTQWPHIKEGKSVIFLGITL